MSQYKLLDPQQDMMQSLCRRMYDVVSFELVPQSAHLTLVMNEGMTIGFAEEELVQMSAKSALAKVARERGLADANVKLAQEEMRKYVKSKAQERNIKLSEDDEQNLANFLISFAHKFDRESD